MERCQVCGCKPELDKSVLREDNIYTYGCECCGYWTRGGESKVEAEENWNDFTKRVRNIRENDITCPVCGADFEDKCVVCGSMFCLECGGSSIDTTFEDHDCGHILLEADGCPKLCSEECEKAYTDWFLKIVEIGKAAVGSPMKENRE